MTTAFHGTDDDDDDDSFEIFDTPSFQWRHVCLTVKKYPRVFMNNGTGFFYNI